MISGKIEKILTQMDNDWGRYQLDCFGKDLLAVGIIPSASVGMSVTLEGHEENTKYGRQYKITSVLKTEADKNAGARRFLSDGYIKGIGPTKADAIISMYGSESVDLFETEEGRKKLCKVKGISLSTIENCLPSYEENKKYKEILMFLNGCVTKYQIETIWGKYGNQALTVLKKNPYRLQMDLDHFGFIKADNIALASGIKKDSIYRIMAASKYAIETATSSGHCYLTINEIKEIILPLLVPSPKSKTLSDKVINNALNEWPANKEKFIKAHNPSAKDLENIELTHETRELINAGFSEAISKAIEEGSLINNDGKIYTKKMYDTETDTANILAEMCKLNPVRYIKKELVEKSIADVEERKTKEFEAQGKGITFRVTDEQRKAVYLASMHRISIISGGPGRGKTAISEIVAHTFLSAGTRYDKRDVIMIAPTGRAAQRITESTGYEAMTAHRAVMTWTKNGYPKDKLILCDETSMVDIYLMHSVAKCVKDCNLILVGDVDQIASVGPGKVLKDLIDSNVIPCILLKEGHRNSGSIAHNATLINSGINIAGLCYDEHFVYTHCSINEVTEKDMYGRATKTYIPMLETVVSDYKKKVEQYGIENVLLCAAMKERGVVAVNKLNNRLQEEFTKGKTQATYGSKKFRLGDRVMQTVNDYNFIKKYKDGSLLGVFNGEKGTITSINYDSEEEANTLTVSFDDGTIGVYTKYTAPNLTLAYATTLHKCQGSEADCMMMIYTFGDYLLLNRSLFYTGETRAKKEFRFYGEEKFQYGKVMSAFDMAVKKIDDTKRNTSLSARIIEAYNS